jgi:hypothetical protein
MVGNILFLKLGGHVSRVLLAQAGKQNVVMGSTRNDDQGQKAHEQEGRNGDNQYPLAPVHTGPDFLDLLDQLLKKVIHRFLVPKDGSPTRPIS